MSSCALSGEYSRTAISRTADRNVHSRITEKELPKLCGSFEVTRGIAPTLAEKFGIDPDVAVSVGSEDSAAIGTGTA